MGTRSLVIKCTRDAPEASNQAFNVAVAALAAGVNVSVWLASEAVRFALPGEAESVMLPHAVALSELRDTIIAEGTLTVCSQCAVRRNLTPADLLADVRIAGAAAFVAEVMAEGAQALVY